MPRHRDPAKSLRALAAALPALVAHAMESTMQEAQAQGRRTTAFHNVTGRLRASIRGGVLEENDRLVVGALTAGANDAQPGRTGWEMPSNEYGPLIELGTARRSPRPFIWPTMVYIAGQNVLGRSMRAEYRKFTP